MIYREALFEEKNIVKYFFHKKEEKENKNEQNTHYNDSQEQEPNVLKL